MYSYSLSARLRVCASAGYSISPYVERTVRRGSVRVRGTRMLSFQESSSPLTLDAFNPEPLTKVCLRGMVRYGVQAAKGIALQRQSSYSHMKRHHALHDSVHESAHKRSKLVTHRCAALHRCSASTRACACLQGRSAHSSLRPCRISRMSVIEHGHIKRSNTSLGKCLSDLTAREPDPTLSLAPGLTI